jgi:predicted RNA-binding Zn-ribbon protein involved in translation (DUF1610 family)
MLRGSSSAEFHCPSCGATSALWLHHPDPQRQDATLRCLSCAMLTTLPKDKVVAAISSSLRRPAGPSEVSSTL